MEIMKRNGDFRRKIVTKFILCIIFDIMVTGDSHVHT